MKLHPITSIDELLKHDAPYSDSAPVVLFERSRWHKVKRTLRSLFSVVF